ncbi:MAG: class D sortase [bacterium]|nr:class D sortase [bacterium]
MVPRRNEGRRDWLVAGGVTLVVFFGLTAASGGAWWYRDAPFPASPQVPSVLPSKDPQASPSPVGESTKDQDAELTIERLGIRVPIVWSASTEEDVLQHDLERGAIHYPGTAIPGSVGNAFIAAHSSDYPWKPGQYKRVFAQLGALKVGDDDIVVTYRDRGGTTRRFRFRVAETAVVRDDDERMFAQGDAPELTLVTCWPLGTSWRRLMVKTVLVETS